MTVFNAMNLRTVLSDMRRLTAFFDYIFLTNRVLNTEMLEAITEELEG